MKKIRFFASLIPQDVVYYGNDLSPTLKTVCLCLFISFTGYSLLRAPPKEWIFACTTVFTPASRAAVLRLWGESLVTNQREVLTKKEPIVTWVHERAQHTHQAESLTVRPRYLDLDELRCYIQLSGVIAAERSLHSAQVPGFSNQGFKISHTLRVHHTVLQLVPVYSCSEEEGVFTLLSVTVGHNVVVSCIFSHWYI